MKEKEEICRIYSLWPWNLGMLQSQLCNWNVFSHLFQHLFTNYFTTSKLMSQVSFNLLLIYFYVLYTTSIYSNWMKMVILRDFDYPYGSRTLYRVLSFYFQFWAQNKNSAYNILLEDSIHKLSRLQSDFMCIYGGMISSVCGILYATYLIQFMFIHYKTTSETFQLVLISYKYL